MIVPLLLLVLTEGLAPAPAPVGPPAPSGATTRCCLTNKDYRGVCVVAIGESETCAGVLAYLNAPNTTGRTYCNSTRLRGRWELVPCPPATPRPSHTADPPDRVSAPCSLDVVHGPR